MNVLITGDLSWVTDDFYNILSSDGRKLVLLSDDTQHHVKKKRPNLFAYSPLAPEVPRIFRNYQFTDVIYLSGSIDGNIQSYGEINALETILKLSGKYRVKKMIYLSSTEIYAGGGKNIQPLSGHQIMLRTAEELCQFYHHQTGLDVITVRIPYLFDMEHTIGLIGSLLNERVTHRCVTMPHSGACECEFLSVSDLGVFISRLLESWDQDGDQFDLSSGETMTFETLANKIKALDNEIEIRYQSIAAPDILISEDMRNGYPVPVQSRLARELYGWFTKVSLLDELPLLMDQQEEAVNQASSYHRLTAKSKKYSYFLASIELFLFFVGVEFLNRKMGVYVQFQYIDLRLLYVVIMGSMHGLGIGVVAALLVCGATMWGYLALNLDWEIIFYTIDNWLPFISYILAGALIGYGRNKSSNEMRLIRSQSEFLQQEYHFLNGLYESALESKERYKEQIAGSRISYGKLYGIIRKLDCESPEMIYDEAVNALEAATGFQSIAIYRVLPDQRLTLQGCSKPLPKRLSQIFGPEAQNAVLQLCVGSEVWVNHEHLDQYPMYCMRLAYREEPLAYLMVFEKEYNKMSIHSCNIIKIIGGLVESSLTRVYLIQEMTGHVNEDAAAVES